MDTDRRQRLEALPGWSWAPRSDKFRAAWEEGFAYLKRFSEREGHSQVLHDYKTEAKFPLGRWVSSQRVQFRSDKLDADRRQRLETLPGWVWKVKK